MAKSKERFEHGEHNEEVCDLLFIQKKFPDWTITTAFYASLHFVSYKIFPFNHKIDSSKTIKVENLEQWQQHKSYISTKRHELLKDLVAKYCDEVSPEYEWLLGLSMTARYHQFQHDPLIVDKAVRLMKKIKKHCQP
jgi:hypothetical protein